jgi:hypothetical protein
VQTLNSPSTARTVVSVILLILAKIGLSVGSFYFFVSTFLLWPHDKLFLLRASIILGSSLAVFIIAGCFCGAPGWQKDFFRTLPLTIFGYGSVGLGAAIIGIVMRRQPHLLTPYEATLLCSAVLVYVIVISHRRRKPRKRRRDSKHA